MSYSLVFESKGFILSHFGRISISEINNANYKILGHEDFDTHRYQIVDLLGADFSGIDVERAVEPAAFDAAGALTMKHVHVALIAYEKKAVEFCNKYISEVKSFGCPWHFRLFKNMSEARQWVFN